MKVDERRLVLERLRELEGWSEYITEALHLDQAREPVKREMLERLVEQRSLREIRERSWQLRDTLHRVATELDLSMPPVDTLS